jgi:hypothetical protein
MAQYRVLVEERDDEVKAVIFGTVAVTVTSKVETLLSNCQVCVASLAEDAATGAGDAAAVSTLRAAAQATNPGEVTLKCWQDDFSAASNAANVDFVAYGVLRT